MKKSIVTSVLLVLVSAVIPIWSSPSGPLFIDDASGNIGTVDISDGNVTVIGNSGQSLTDIGFTSNGDLYGTTFTGFYSINKSTGAANLISNYGSIGDGDMNALVGAGNQLLASSGRTDQLYVVDVSPYGISSLNGTTEAVGSAGDLAFTLSGGDLYVTLNNGDLDKITISGTSFTSTTVGNMGNDNVYGMATGDDGVTYAVSDTEIYSLNLQTAQLTPILNYGGHGLGAAYGTAFISEGKIPTTVPEPRQDVLLVSSLVVLLFYLRRQRN